MVWCGGEWKIWEEDGCCRTSSTCAASKIPIPDSLPRTSSVIESPPGMLVPYPPSFFSRSSLLELRVLLLPRLMAAAAPARANAATTDLHELPTERDDDIADAAPYFPYCLPLLFGDDAAELAPLSRPLCCWLCCLLLAPVPTDARGIGAACADNATRSEQSVHLFPATLNRQRRHDGSSFPPDDDDDECIIAPPLRNLTSKFSLFPFALCKNSLKTEISRSCGNFLVFFCFLHHSLSLSLSLSFSLLSLLHYHSIIFFSTITHIHTHTHTHTLPLTHTHHHSSHPPTSRSPSLESHSRDHENRKSKLIFLHTQGIDTHTYIYSLRFVLISRSRSRAVGGRFLVFFAWCVCVCRRDWGERRLTKKDKRGRRQTTTYRIYTYTCDGEHKSE